jgi:hypothetical protein
LTRKSIIGAAALFLIAYGVQAWAVPVVHTCKPVSIAVYPGSRIHIQCDIASTSTPPITYFALPNVTSDDVQRANQAIAVASTAQTSGKSIGILFDDVDTSGTTFGCGANNCRKIQGIFLNNN